MPETLHAHLIHRIIPNSKLKYNNEVLCFLIVNSSVTKPVCTARTNCACLRSKPCDSLVTPQFHNAGTLRSGKGNCTFYSYQCFVNALHGRRVDPGLSKRCTEKCNVCIYQILPALEIGRTSIWLWKPKVRHTQGSRIYRTESGLRFQISIGVQTTISR
jgi:hypothetical protein